MGTAKDFNNYTRRSKTLEVERGKDGAYDYVVSRGAEIESNVHQVIADTTP
jgi:hypothetical protein